MNKLTKVNRKVIWIAFVAVLMVFLFQIKTTKAASDVIHNDATGIPDKYLYREILFALDKKNSDTFTEKEAESIYDLDSVDYSGKNKIRSLKGIGYLKNLVLMNIHENSLTNLEGIEQLSNLKTLKIGKGNLKNLNELKTLTNIKELSIEGNSFNDLGAINQMSQLRNLSMTKCNLDDVKAKDIVKNLVKLTELNISDNGITDLSILRNLTNLEILSANKCKIKTLSGIDSLKKLKRLYLANNKLTSISGLEKLEDLECLDLSNNNIKRLSDLKNLSELSMEYTSFAGNRISKKEFIDKLPSHMEKWWINNEVIIQKTKKKLSVFRINRIKSKTKQIKGVTESKAVIILKTFKGKKIKKVSAEKNGKFVLKKLNLKKYKGKKLKIVAYLKYNDRINGESHYSTVRTVKFSVK